MADAVARIARQGVDQYLDVGAGLPTRPSTHATARALLPAARVVYIDRDPVVVEHGTDLVPAGVRYQGGDLTEPEALLALLAPPRPQPGSSTSPGRSAWCSRWSSRRSSPAPPGPSSASSSRRCRRAATWWRPSARATPGGCPTRSGRPPRPRPTWPPSSADSTCCRRASAGTATCCAASASSLPREAPWMRSPPASSSRRRSSTPRRPRSWPAPTAAACSSTRR